MFYSMPPSILSELYLVRGDVSWKVVFVHQRISGSVRNVTPRRERERRDKGGRENKNFMSCLFRLVWWEKEGVI